MEEDSSQILKLSRPDSMQESKPRRRWRKRDQNVVENTQPYKPRIKRYPIPGEDTMPPSTSRGEKRRNIEDEDDGQNVKRLMTKHTNLPDSGGLHHDESSQSKSMITVSLNYHGCDRTDERIVFEKPTLHMNDNLPERGEMRKPEFDHYSQEGIKRLRVSPNSKESNTSDHLNSDDSFGYIPCENSCVCKVGSGLKPTPIERRGNPKIPPLYKKLLQRRMLNIVNVVMNDCCERQCCQFWSGRRYSNQRFEDCYGPSDLRVDHFSWGVWKQKSEIQNNNNDDDDWFW